MEKLEVNHVVTKLRRKVTPRRRQTYPAGRHRHSLSVRRPSRSRWNLESETDSQLGCSRNRTHSDCTTGLERRRATLSPIAGGATKLDASVKSRLGEAFAAQKRTEL
uniref:Uncharacterized protein n=1 Tax=Steinernema glaseri TaxID=37863 RepID=A0A1I8AV98_9BILA